MIGQANESLGSTLNRRLASSLQHPEPSDTLSHHCFGADLPPKRELSLSPAFTQVLTQGVADRTAATLSDRFRWQGNGNFSVLPTA